MTATSKPEREREAVTEKIDGCAVPPDVRIRLFEEQANEQLARRFVAKPPQYPQPRESQRQISLALKRVKLGTALKFACTCNNHS